MMMVLTMILVVVVVTVTVIIEFVFTFAGRWSRRHSPSVRGCVVGLFGSTWSGRLRRRLLLSSDRRRLLCVGLIERLALGARRPARARRRRRPRRLRCRAALQSLLHLLDAGFEGL